MVLITRKPVFGVCDQGRLKLAYAAAEARQRLEISDIETRGIILSSQRTTKALIRLCGCTGRSAPLLLASGKNRFSHDEAHRGSYTNWSINMKIMKQAFVEFHKFRKILFII